VNTSVIVEMMISGGFFAAIGEGVRWYLGRGKTRIDNAQVVQGMAIDMLKPLHEELDRLNGELASMRERVTEADRALSAVIEWALAAKRILDQHSIDYPMVPDVILRRESA